MDPRSFFAGKSKIFICVGVMVAFVLPIVMLLDFDIKGHFDGIFLVSLKDGNRYELTDDIFLGEGHRVVWGANLDDTVFKWLRGRQHDSSSLYTEWDARNGNGLIRNFLPDGGEIQTCFSRFVDENGLQPRGLIVGGGLPPSAMTSDSASQNETGMAYFNGKRWFHIWCNVNEGLVAGSSNDAITPSHWKFLGSRVIEQSRKRVVIQSSHELAVGSVPLRIDRSARFEAGKPFFLLSIQISNTGNAPASFAYVYGDEPWLGNFGSSRGNVGWVADRLIQYETGLDEKYDWAGFFDTGNSVIGETGNFTGIANFIEWQRVNRPFVFFSNDANHVKDFSGRKVPLSSMTRFIGLQWGPLTLQPGESIEFGLAIGMAGNDPRTGFPTKPDTKLSTGH